MITEWQRAHARLRAAFDAGARQQKLDALRDTIAVYQQQLEPSTSVDLPESEWIEHWSFSALLVKSEREVIIRVRHRELDVAELVLVHEALFEPGGTGWVLCAAPPIGMPGQVAKRHQPRKSLSSQAIDDPLLLWWQSLLSDTAIKLIQTEAATYCHEQYEFGAQLGAEGWLIALEEGEPLSANRMKARGP